MLRMLIVPVLQLSTDNDNKGDDSRDFLFIQVLTRAAQASPSTAAAVSAAAPAQHTSPNQVPPLPSPAPPASVCTGANMWLSSVSYLSTWNIFDELVELLAHFQGKWENWMLISQKDLEQSFPGPGVSRKRIREVHPICFHCQCRPMRTVLHRQCRQKVLLVQSQRG